MNRYEIAIQKRHLENSKVTGFHFVTPPKNVKQIISYIKICIKNETILYGENIPEDKLNVAVIEASKLYKIPILVETELEAKIFSITQSYTDIYHVNNLPHKQLFILYNCPREKIPQDISVFVEIRGKKKS